MLPEPLTLGIAMSFLKKVRGDLLLPRHVARVLQPAPPPQAVLRDDALKKLCKAHAANMLKAPPKAQSKSTDAPSGSRFVAPSGSGHAQQQKMSAASAAASAAASLQLAGARQSLFLAGANARIEDVKKRLSGDALTAAIAVITADTMAALATP